MIERPLDTAAPLNGAQAADRRLPVRKKVGFGVADIGGNLFFTAMGFWTLTYLTDTVYLAPALAGIAIMAAKIWDAVTDPIVGYFPIIPCPVWGGGARIYCSEPYRSGFRYGCFLRRRPLPGNRRFFGGRC